MIAIALPTTIESTVVSTGPRKKVKARRRQEPHGATYIYVNTLPVVSSSATRAHERKTQSPARDRKARAAKMENLRASKIGKQMPVPTDFPGCMWHIRRRSSVRIALP